MNRFRLILDPPRSAALNMAIDEMLMESQSSPAAMPALRFYSWVSPAYSIGYFQNVSEIAKRYQSKKMGLPIVRRMTGGGLVFHGQDITFSIAVKGNNPFFSGSAKESYLKANEAVRTGLKRLYPKIDYADCKSIPSGRAKGNRVCFEAPVCYDLLLEGKKVVGASQRRKNNLILHQSSIFLEGNETTLRNHIVEGFKQNWNIDFFEEPLTPSELELANQIEKKRYTSTDWSL